MKIRITESWAKATGRATDPESRTFEVVGEPDVNLVGAKGFDAFYLVRDGSATWTVAAARVEEVITAVEEPTVIVHLQYRTPGFDGNDFALETVRESDLEALSQYWDSDSCCNVESWHIVDYDGDDGTSIMYLISAVDRLIEEGADAEDSLLGDRGMSMLDSEIFNHVALRMIPNTLPAHHPAWTNFNRWINL